MTDHTYDDRRRLGRTYPRPDRENARHGFEDAEGLRALLNRLHDAGSGAWQDDPEVAALMRHAATKYAALARKHGLDPWEAATAAFHAMRKPNARAADDPWAIVTTAVRVTCIAEERGTGLLCSVDRARRPEYSVFHDAERFSDRENPLPEYHSAFHIDPFGDDDPAAPSTPPDGQTGVGAAVEDAIALLCLHGWDPQTARSVTECVCARLAVSSSRAGAFESLRRDKHARALLDLPLASWTGVLRVLLGNPDPHLAHTRAGRGVLLRLLVDEPLHALDGDETLTAAVALAAPRKGTGPR